MASVNEDRIDIRVERQTIWNGREYWYAYDDCTYDGAPDGGNVHGFGETKWAAVRALVDMMAEHEVTA